MKRITLYLIILVLSLGLSLPVTGAQSTAWVAWLYDPDQGLLTAITESGAIADTFTLPTLRGFNRYPNRVAVAPGGTPIAYVVYNSVTYQGALIVSQRDQQVASFALPVTLSDSTEFAGGDSLFKEDNSALALGYSLDGGGWALIVLDLRSGQVTHTLRHDSPLVGVLGLPAGVGQTPVVRQFAGRTVTFSMVQSGTEGAPRYDSFDWNIDSGVIASNPVFPGLNTDRLPATGEVIMSLLDERLQSQQGAFFYAQANTLQVFDPASGSRFPFYTAADRSFSSPRFIQNGELVLADSVDAAQRYAWQVISRDGRLVGELPTAVSILDVRGLPDGFVYTTDTFSPGVITLMVVNTRDGLDAGVPVWNSQPNTRLSLAYASAVVPGAQAAFSPWTQLAEPVYGPGVVVPAAPAPDQPLLANPASVGPEPTLEPALPRGGFLVVGGLATVNTTGGDQLNLRLGPGVGFDVVAKLGAGARVMLLDGPRAADGFAWWKIRTGSGIEGWAVESVDDNGVRLQTLMPG